MIGHTLLSVRQKRQQESRLVGPLRSVVPGGQDGPWLGPGLAASDKPRGATEVALRPEKIVCRAFGLESQRTYYSMTELCSVPVNTPFGRIYIGDPFRDLSSVITPLRSVITSGPKGPVGHTVVGLGKYLTMGSSRIYFTVKASRPGAGSHDVVASGRGHCRLTRVTWPSRPPNSPVQGKCSRRPAPARPLPRAAVGLSSHSRF